MYHESDSYSPTAHSTIENTSNRRPLLCYLVHSTSPCTSTSFSYLPTDRYFRSTFDHSRYHAVRLIFSDRPFNLRKHIKPSPTTVLLGSNLPHYALLPHSAIFRLTVTSGQPLAIPCTTSQTHILRPPIQPSKTHRTVTLYCATWSILPHRALLPHSAIFRLTATSGQPLTIQPPFHGCVGYDLGTAPPRHGSYGDLAPTEHRLVPAARGSTRLLHHGCRPAIGRRQTWGWRCVDIQQPIHGQVDHTRR